MHWTRKDFIKAIGAGSLASLLPAGRLHSAPSEPLLKPPRLKQGGTLGLISPASRLAPPLTYEEVIASIERLGFRVKLGAHYRDSNGSLAGTDEARVSDLHAMFSDTAVYAILPFRGGWGSNRLLGHMDFELIRANPKPLIGYSDITSLLLAIHAKTGMVTFHGPVAKSNWTDFTLQSFNRTLMSGQPFELRNPAEYRDRGTFYTLNPGRADGRLLGGNLTVITSMLGSDYLPEWEGSILFVEDVGEDIYRIDRMLTQMALNGILKKLNGFIFGSCVACNKSSERSRSLEQVLADHIKPLNIPAFYGSMIGHIDDMFTIPLGIEATLYADKGIIYVRDVPTS